MSGAPVPDAAPPSIGAFVVNYNGGAKVLRCLDALRAQSTPPSEILVVDNGSSDGSPDEIRQRFPEVRVLALGANRGVSVARNAGLKALVSELALSVDSDVYLERGCLERMRSTWLERRPAALCPRVLLLPEEDVVQCDGAEVHFVGTLALRHAFRPRQRCPEETAEVGAAIGACLLLERERALEAGGFDELLFFYFEDLEFSLKLAVRGLAIVCDPGARVRHERGEGTPGLSYRGGVYPKRRARLSMRHRWAVILVYYRWRTLAVLTPVLAAYELATLALSLRNGWLGAWAGGWAWLFAKRGEIRARRRRTQRARRVGDRALLSGGPLPLAPQLLGPGPAKQAADAFGRLLDAYWRGTRRWIG